MKATFARTWLFYWLGFAVRRDHVCENGDYRVDVITMRR